MAKSNFTGVSQVPTMSANGTPADAGIPRSGNEQIDFSWRVIQRCDAYINAANTKAAIILTFNSFVFATVVLKWAEISQNFGHHRGAVYLAAVLLLICAIASECTLNNVQSLGWVRPSGRPAF